MDTTLSQSAQVITVPLILCISPPQFPYSVIWSSSAIGFSDGTNGMTTSAPSPSLTRTSFAPTFWAAISVCFKSAVLSVLVYRSLLNRLFESSNTDFEIIRWFARTDKYKFFGNLGFSPLSTATQIVESNQWPSNVR